MAILWDFFSAFIFVKTKFHFSFVAVSDTDFSVTGWCSSSPHEYTAFADKLKPVCKLNTIYLSSVNSHDAKYIL